jgi:hypothetical protein
VFVFVRREVVAAMLADGFVRVCVLLRRAKEEEEEEERGRIHHSSTTPRRDFLFSSALSTQAPPHPQNTTPY